MSIIYYDWLPKSAREFISPVVEPALSFIQRGLLIVSHIRLPLYLLKGKGKWSESSLTTLFFGKEWLVPYFSDFVYLEEPTKERLGKIFIWKIKSRLNLDIPKADLIFIRIDEFFSRFLSRQGFIVTPERVSFILDLSKPLSEIWKLSKNKSLREDLRMIRKHKYSYEISHDPAEFKYFYYQMYLPYMPKRFGKLTTYTSFQRMKRTFEKGQLLLVKQGNEYVSGNIIALFNSSAFFASLGIKEGKIEYLKQGALSAAYYFGILWAKEKGYKRLDFGHCRPFLNDGIFCYKKKWGMGIKRSKRVRTVFGMKICGLHQGALDFLAKNPLIFTDQEKLKGLILIEQNHPLTLGEVQSLIKTCYIPGVDCLVIISPQGFTQQAKEFATSCFNPRLNLISTKPDIFFKKFPHILNMENYNHSGNKSIKNDA